MSAGAWVLVVTLAAALAFGLYRAATDGRFRGTHAVRGASEAAPSNGGADDGPSAGGHATGDEPHAGRASTAVSGSRPHPAIDTLVADGGLALGERATLLQFSSAFCAPCRATRRVLADVAEAVPGVVHHEVDAEHHLDLARALGVLRTPTTLILDADGVEISRAAGAPSRAQVLVQLPERG